MVVKAIKEKNWIREGQEKKNQRCWKKLNWLRMTVKKKLKNKRKGWEVRWGSYKLWEEDEGWEDFENKNGDRKIKNKRY